MRLNKDEKSLLKFMAKGIGTVTITKGSLDENTAQKLWSKNLIKYIQSSVPFGSGYWQLNNNGWNESSKLLSIKSKKGK